MNGRENTSFSWHRVLDHLGLTPLFAFNYTANYDGVNGWYYQIGVIKYTFLDYERYSNSLSSGCSLLNTSKSSWVNISLIP